MKEMPSFSFSGSFKKGEGEREEEAFVLGTSRRSSLRVRGAVTARGE